MRLHVLDQEFPLLVDAWESDELRVYGDEVLCFDSPLAYNFQIGDQIQHWLDDSLFVYLVIDVRPAENVVTPCTLAELDGVYLKHRITVVTLRNYI